MGSRKIRSKITIRKMIRSKIRIKIRMLRDPAGGLIFGRRPVGGTLIPNRGSAGFVGSPDYDELTSPPDHRRCLPLRSAFVGKKRHPAGVSCAGRALFACCSLAVAASTAWAFDPLNGDYSKDHPLDVRIMAYNHQGNFISDSSRDTAFNRILVAVSPDLICFEEFPSSVSQSAIASRLNSVLPISGGSWQVHLGLLGGTRNVLASRYQLTLTRTDTIPASSTRGVTIGLANLPDADYALDVYLLGVHLKCCGDPGGSEDAQRQDSADAIANWLGDARGVARASGNNIVLPANTPMIALGDFNLVGGPQPENTILTGNIQQEADYGPDVKGDWDNSDLTNLNPLDPFTGDNFTWQGNGTFDPSPLDRMFYTDSAFIVANSFVLNTDTMTPAALAAAGLQSADTLPSSTSDHLPIVMDLRLAQCVTNAQCDDGLFCNGAETCSAGTCQPGAPLALDDGVACTVDWCDETNNGIVHAPDDGLCDDGVFCDGVESCDALLGCQSGTDPCQQTEWCDEAGPACVTHGDGDFEPDGDVDLADVAAFQRCFGQSAASSCLPANLVGADAMVDLADHGAFVEALTGP